MGGGGRERGASSYSMQLTLFTDGLTDEVHHG